MDYRDDYCIVTESTPSEFNRTQTSIHSFVKHNLWFDGVILILISEFEEFDKNQLAILNQIYDRIEVLKVSDELIEIQKIIRRKKIGDNLLKDYFYLYALNIKAKGVLYFNRRVIFNRSVIEFMVSEGCSFALKSGRFPQGSGYAVNYNMFYLHGGGFQSLFNSALNTVLNSKSIFDKDVKSLSLITSLSKNEISITRHPMLSLVDASNFPDNRYSNFVRYSKKVIGINMDTLETSERFYGRINLFWNQVRISSTKLSPSKVDLNKVVKQQARKLPIPREELDSSPFKDEYLKRSKIAMCTICDDNFIEGAEAMIHSFISNNGWFMGDIIVMYSDNLSKLSPSSMSRLKSIKRDIIFKKVNEEEYAKAIDKFVNKNGLHLKFMPSLFTFETFALDKYDCVCYIDSDILHINDMKEFFLTGGSYVVTPASLRYPAVNYKEFSGGMFMVRGRMISKKIKDDLIQFSIRTNRFGLLDQTIMNDYFKNWPKTYAHNKFNCSKRCFDDSIFRRFNPDEVALIHYVAEKPWNHKTKQSETRYSKLENIWKKYYNSNIKGSFDLPRKKRLVVIGNSPSVTKNTFGKAINEFDIIVRVNDFRTIGYEKYVGSKTDYVMSSFATNFMTKEYDSIHPAQIMMSLFDKKGQIEFLKNRIERYNIEDINTLDSAYFIELNKELGITDGIKRCTSGTIAIKWAMDTHPDYDIYIHGIDLDRSDAHYFNQPKNKVSSWFKSIDIYHDFDKEISWINQLISTRKINRLI